MKTIEVEELKSLDPGKVYCVQVTDSADLGEVGEALSRVGEAYNLSFIILDSQCKMIEPSKDILEMIKSQC